MFSNLKASLIWKEHQECFIEELVALESRLFKAEPLKFFCYERLLHNLLETSIFIEYSKN